jgi:hypothetical protein
MTDLRQAAKAVVDRWDSPKWEWRDQGPTADLMAALRTALAQPEQGPVAKLFGTLPVYDTTPPPQRPWQGLTDEEMSDTVADMEVDFGDLLWKVVCLTKLIEAQLKERNGY